VCVADVCVAECVLLLLAVSATFPRLDPIHLLDPPAFDFAPIPSSGCPPPFNTGNVAYWLTNAGGGTDINKTLLSKKYVQHAQYVEYVCTVCTVCMPSMPSMYAQYVCTVCMHSMYAQYVCTVCTRHSSHPTPLSPLLSPNPSIAPALTQPLYRPSSHPTPLSPLPGSLRHIFSFSTAWVLLSGEFTAPSAVISPVSRLHAQ
jgi:hypothetical protein